MTPRRSTCSSSLCKAQGVSALAGMLSSNNDKIVPDETLDLLLTEAMASAY